MMRNPIIGSFSTLIEAETKSGNRAPRPAIDLPLSVQESEQSGQAATVANLQDGTRLKLDQSGEFVTTLKNAGWVTLDGDWGRETLRLTALGKSVAQAAMPK